MCVLCNAAERRHEEITSSAKLWPQMKERQSERVRWMSTFHGTNGMSVKHWYTDAFSPERPEMLSGDAALLFQPYSGCTGNILSFYPSTSPRSISDPLTINDFFSLPKFAPFGFFSFSFPCVGLLISNATFFLFSLDIPPKFFAFLPIYLNDKDLRRGIFLWNQEGMQAWLHTPCCRFVHYCCFSWGGTLPRGPCSSASEGADEKGPENRHTVEKTREINKKLLKNAWILDLLTRKMTLNQPWCVHETQKKAVLTQSK